MEANILPADPPPTPDTGGWGQKLKIHFLELMDMLDIKLKEIEHLTATIAQLVERQLLEREVEGSNPGRTIPKV